MKASGASAPLRRNEKINLTHSLHGEPEPLSPLFPQTWAWGALSNRGAFFNETEFRLAMLLVVPLLTAAALVGAPSASRARRHGPISAAAPSYHRAKDILATGDAVSAKDIVNVLGRWQSYEEWEGVGELVAMDRLMTADGKMKVELPAQQSSGLLAKKKGNGEWVKKTPQRRAFCVRNGLCQRYWHGENVGLLRFRSEALARSVGATVSELSRRPIEPLAAEVVFDALSQANRREI